MNNCKAYKVPWPINSRAEELLTHSSLQNTNYRALETHSFPNHTRKMSAEGSATFSTAIVEPDVNRRSANYAPSVWGDHFLSYATDSMVKVIFLGIDYLTHALDCMLILSFLTLLSDKASIVFPYSLSDVNPQSQSCSDHFIKGSTHK